MTARPAPMPDAPTAGPRTAVQPASAPASALRALAAAWWPLVLLAVVAFAARWPNLWYIPQFTDEVFDAQVSFDILQGTRPLTGVNAYTGAFHYYVQAGLFWAFGPSIYLPRLLIMIMGVGAVLATAVLGAEIARRAAAPGDRRSALVAGWIGALVAGGLLATSAVHVLTNSHLAWPHCTVLLYLTGSFWLLERAIRLGRPDPRLGGPSLVGAGLAFGLAQQQHPTMLLLWPVLLGYVAWRGRRFFRTRWAYAALAAFVIGISPLIVYNLVLTNFDTIRESAWQVDNYREEPNKDLSYRGRAVEMLVTAARIPASAIDTRPTPAAYLLDPTVIGYTALMIAGLVAATRLGAPSLALATVVFLAFLPIFPASHDQLPRQGRYLMPLLPLALAGVGGLAALIWLRLRVAGPAVRIGLAAILAVVVLYPLVPLARYELDVLAANETNDRYYVTLGALERQRRPGEWVVLDPTLQRDRTGAAGTAQRTFDFMTELRGIPRTMLDASSERIATRIQGQTAVVLADLEPSSLRNRANAGAWDLEPLPNDEGGGFTLWRITRR